MIDRVLDWQARLRSRLYDQFKNKLTHIAWANLLGRQFQDLEDAAQSLLTIMDIGASEGVNLDVLGRIVVQLRNSVDDPTYRSYLRARVLANRSEGTYTDIYKTIAAVLGGTLDTVVQKIEGSYPAGLILRVVTAMTDATAAVAIQFLTAARSAPVYAILVYQSDVDSEMFTVEPVATYLTVAALDSDPTLTVASTAGFPASGLLQVDEGTPEGAAMNYTIGGPTTFNIPGGVDNNHPLNAAVVLVGTVGKGFDDDNAPGGGGKLAGDFNTL